MADRNKIKRDNEPDANRDPITKEPGSHPVSTGVGAAAAGAAGAALGAMAGPLGAVAGAIIGAAAGGAAGHAVGEKIDPTVEHAYWRENYKDREYVTPGSDYETYQPAYQYGWENYSRYEGRSFEDVEGDLERDWENYRGNKSRLEWEQARHATQDSWNRLRDRFNTDDDDPDTGIDFEDNPPSGVGSEGGSNLNRPRS